MSCSSGNAFAGETVSAIWADIDTTWALVKLTKTDPKIFPTGDLTALLFRRKPHDKRACDDCRIEERHCENTSNITSKITLLGGLTSNLAMSVANNAVRCGGATAKIMRHRFAKNDGRVSMMLDCT